MNSPLFEAENKHGIVPFKGNNFDNWKFKLKAILMAMDVNEVLEEGTSETTSDAWIKKDNKACNIIVQCVADSHLEYIKDLKTAREMINKLEWVFAKKGLCSKFYLLKELVSLKYGPSEDLQRHFSKYDKILRELRSLDTSFQDSDIACFLLLSMPKENENIVTAIRTVAQDNLSLEIVKKRLLEFKVEKGEVSKIRNEVSASFVAVEGNLKCHKCGKLGHLQNVCGLKCYACNKFGHKAYTSLHK